MITTGKNNGQAYDPTLWQPMSTKESSFDAKLWQPVAANLPSKQLSPEKSEAEREKVEGPEPELADAPVANAVMSGALTPGALANLGAEGGELGLKAAIKGAASFGVQQEFQDFADKILDSPLKNHPYLRQALSAVGGILAYEGAGHALNAATAGKSAAEGIDTLKRVATTSPEIGSAPEAPIELTSADEVKDAAKRTAEATNLVPAIKIKPGEKEEVIAGKPGETHGDIIARIPEDKLKAHGELNDSNRGFVTKDGKFLSREEASKATGAENLHSVGDVGKEEPVTLGAGMGQIVPAAQKVISMLPEDVRSSPAKIGKTLQRTFAPETDGAFAQRTAELQESKSAELRARIGSAARALQPLRDHFESLPEQARYTLASQMENGDFSQLPAELQGFGPVMKDITDAAHNRLQKLSPDKQVGYVENYWRHMWANTPAEVMDAFNRIKSGSGKALTAGKGFLKQRRFATIQDGIDAGLTPKFRNPVDQWLSGVQQEWRYVTGKEMFDGIKDSGLTKFVRVTERPPKEYAKINDSIARVMGPTDKGVAHLGDYYVPQEVARIFNNYLDPGLGPNPLASLSALGNRIRVEFSGFHFLLTSMSSVAQKVGDQFVDGLGDLAHGNIGRGALKIALSPAKAIAGPVDTYKDWQLGRDVISRALGGKLDDPAVSDVILGGGSFDFGDSNAGHMISESWKNAWGIPQKLADKTAVIMKQWVAPLKVGTQLRLYNAALKRAYEANGNQILGLAERRTIATQVRRHVDNVMGQIVRDNLHYSNQMKDAMHLVTSYPGWQIGTLRLMGGAARGIAKGAVGSKMDMQAQQALRYVTGMIITGGTIGTLANLMATGKMPTSISEMYLWPTGEKDANGNEIRTEPPEYLVRDYLSVVGHRRGYSPNDVMAWPKAIGESAVSKMNWPLAAASYIMRNADFFGKPIYFPDFDSQPKQIQKIVGQFLNEGGVPFSVKNAGELLQEGKSTGKSLVAGAIGLTPESRVLRQTPAQNFIDQAMKSPQQQPQSPDQAQREQVLSQFTAQLRRQKAGGPKVDMEPVKQALRSGLITEKEFTQRVEDSDKRPFQLAVGRASLPIALQAWKIASDNGDEQDEKDAAAEIFRKIRNGAMANLPPDQQAQAKSLLGPFLKKLRGESGEEAR